MYDRFGLINFDFVAECSANPVQIGYKFAVPKYITYGSKCQVIDCTTGYRVFGQRSSHVECMMDGWTAATGCKKGKVHSYIIAF